MGSQLTFASCIVGAYLLAGTAASEPSQAPVAGGPDAVLPLPPGYEIRAEDTDLVVNPPSPAESVDTWPLCKHGSDVEYIDDDLLGLCGYNGATVKGDFGGSTIYCAPDSTNMTSKYIIYGGTGQDTLPSKCKSDADCKNSTAPTEVICAIQSFDEDPSCTYVAPKACFPIYHHTSNI